METGSGLFCVLDKCPDAWLVASPAMNRVMTGVTDGGEIGVSFLAAPFVRLMVDVVSGFAAEPTPAAGLLHDAVALLLPTI